MDGNKADHGSQRDQVRVADQHLGWNLIQRFFRNPNQARDPGQELVEFALVLPLLLIVLIGVFDLGRVFHANVTIANASRSGARYATSFGFDETGGVINFDIVGIKDKVELEAQNSGITLDRNLITINCPGACTQGGTLEVTTNHNFLFQFNAFLGSGITLSQTTEMLIPW